jgi:hypothetical protein
MKNLAALALLGLVSAEQVLTIATDAATNATESIPEEPVE